MSGLPDPGGRRAMSSHPQGTLGLCQKGTGADLFKTGKASLLSLTLHVSNIVILLMFKAL